MSARKRDRHDPAGAEAEGTFTNADGTAAGRVARDENPGKAESAERPGAEEAFEEEAITGEILEDIDAPDEDAGDKEGADQLNDRLLRLSADFDNFRKRTQRDKEEWSRYASQSIVERLLPVVDSFDAAEAVTANAGQEAKTVAEGFLMIRKQLMDTLMREGLTEIQALGESFDPNVHEAVMTVGCEEDQADNQVVMVMRKGYMFKDKVLRPAMVQVARDS